MRVYTVIHGEVEPISSQVFNFVKEENFFSSIGQRLTSSVGNQIVSIVDIYKEEMTTHYLSDLNDQKDSGILAIMSTFVKTKTSEVL